MDSLATVRTCYAWWKNKFKVDSWAKKSEEEVEKLDLAYKQRLII
jgi:hypothetical protein